MANRSINKRMDDIKRAVNPPNNDIVVWVDWGDETTRITYRGKQYTKAEWEAVRADFGFDETIIHVTYEDRDPEDQDDLSSLYKPVD